ncbi:hypothetical protein ACH0CV_15505 [Brachybacterium paraconglomeratum]|uniref:hypothetical protein n=1 Tax=Brachybacterium paraconglomeratum TaxID=173362 RepID=UPI0038793E31
MDSVTKRLLEAGQHATAALHGLGDSVAGSEIDLLCTPSDGGYVSLWSGLQICAEAVGEATVSLRGLRQVEAELPASIMTMTRLALVNANRVAYVLTPPDPSERDQRALKVLAADVESFEKATKAAAGFTDLDTLRDAAAGMRTAVVEDRRNLGLQQKVSDTMISKDGPRDVGMIIAAAFSQQDLPASELAARDRLPQNTAEAVQWIWNVASGFAHGYSWPRVADTLVDLWHNVSTAMFYAGAVMSLLHLAHQTSRQEWSQLMADHAQAGD